MTSSKDPHKRLWEMIKETRFAMLTHRHRDGTLHAHPLTTQNKSLDEDTLYFFVSRRTELGDRVRIDGTVNVSYSNPDKDQYVSISGRAQVSEDKDLKKQLFNALAKAWFPGGVDDPDLELIQIKIEHAEYWDVKESKVSQLFKMASAAVSGEVPEMGEHRELHPG
jgi:general stress protein 26